MQNNRGMTLIEILVVVFIIAGLITLTASPKPNQKYISRHEIQKLKTLFRQTQSTARLNNKVYRIKFLLDTEDENGQPIQQSYLVEKKSEATDAKIINEDGSEKEAQPSDGFEVAIHIAKKPRVVPKLLIITHIEVQGDADKIDEGEAFIYFSPNGNITEAIISIDVGLAKNWSLITHPFIAKLDLVKEDLDLKDIKKDL